MHATTVAVGLAKSASSRSPLPMSTGISFETSASAHPVRALVR